MSDSRPIPEDFQQQLAFKEQHIIDLFKDLRAFLLDLYPDSTELLYHTHALTSVLSVSDKLSDAFCMMPIYTRHMNLGFNKGTLINDPHQLLTGTGNLIRHIPVATPADYRNKKVKDLVLAAIDFALADREAPGKLAGQTISKIKRK